MDHLDESLKVLDFTDTAVKMGRILREQENCQYVIALTHMRLVQDRKLAENKKIHGLIDLILGGHDHMQLFEEFNNGKLALVKSGSDFKEFSCLKINV